MFAGPIFSRELLTAPRQVKHYLLRSGYVGLFLVLMWTTWQATFGWQQVQNIGDVARFGSLVFQLFSLVQISLVLFFSLLLAAGNVAQEKDRHTLILLLMTDLRSHELVLGKLFSGALPVVVLLATSIPVFTMIHMLGGIDVAQVVWMLLLCAATGFASASWGVLVAFWREKTFQTLAIGVLGIVLGLGLVETVVAVVGLDSTVGRWAALLDPYRTLFALLNPLGSQTGLEPVRVSAIGSVSALFGLGVVANVVTIARLRVWNPTQSVFDSAKQSEDSKAATTDATAKPARTRNIWKNPVIWREICTRAYGRKAVLIKLAYVMVATVVVIGLIRSGTGAEMIVGVTTKAGFAFAGLSFLSLMLINAQAVTALTSERDANTLELLLVTDVTAKEFVYGKLGGVLYNTKELILIPAALMGYYLSQSVISGESFVCLLLGYFVLVTFSAMLGLHSGFANDHSRAAITNSLGTMFFLFVGILIFMLLLIEARSSFALQLPSFLLFIVVGSIALWFSLTKHNPSVALGMAAGVLPFLTFYAITSFLLFAPLAALFAILSAYGFATVAMLIPAVSDFDVVLGRSTEDRG